MKNDEPENDLINHLLRYESLNNEEIEAISNSFDIVTLNSNEYFLRQGQICRNLGFVVSGLMMYYKIEDNGKELVCDFSKENEWVTQYQSLTTNSPSPLSIKAIETTTIYAISFEKLKNLSKAVPKFETIARQLVSSVFFNIVNRSNNLQSLSAEERYTTLLNENPSLLQRVPQYYIASYLGIAPQSLSRIRKNISG